MGTQADSSDESADDERLDGTPRSDRVFQKVSPCWRSGVLSEFMWMLDMIASRQRLPKVGCRRVAGALPRTRLPALTVNKYSVAPPGLPRNCYSQDWLRTLWKHELDALAMQDHDYDFSIPDTHPIMFPLDTGPSDLSAATSAPSTTTRRFHPYSAAHPITQHVQSSSSGPTQPLPALSGIRPSVGSPSNVPAQHAAPPDTPSVSIPSLNATNVSSNKPYTRPSPQSVHFQHPGQANRNVVVEEVFEP